MRVIGLTGSIGSGKSTVSERIIDRGFVLIDADTIARNITEGDSPVLLELTEHFGPDILNADGSLNREKLGEMVFSDPQKKEALMGIVTSKVINIIDDRLFLLREEDSSDIVFLDAPVLYESGALYLVDEVWVVVAKDEIRAKRVMTRDGCSYEEFLRRNENQLSQEEKVMMADRVIDNSGGLADLYRQVDYLLNELETDYLE